MNGIINVYKEKGMTSHDVVYRVRKILKTRKVGHAGTLDPEAEGVLVIGVGSGTRLLEYVGDGYKVYEGEIVFGYKSDTEDMYGKLTRIDYDGDKLSTNKLRDILESISGKTISQKPPMYSSVKINGRKLYQYARAGQEIDRPSRNIEIVSLVLQGEIENIAGINRARFKAAVSKGTYIRTLCVHIGELMEIPAVMGGLKRIQVGHFKVEDSKKLEELSSLEEAADFSFIQPLRDAVIDIMLQIDLDEESYLKIRQGQKIENMFPVENGTVFAGIYQDKLACILKNADGIIRIIKNVGE